MKVSLDQDLVKAILPREDFYNEVPEFFFLKEAGSQIAEALSRDGGCTSCTENNLINPTMMAFIAHTVNMYMDCGARSCENLKAYIKKMANDNDITVSVLYRENDESELAEILI